MEIDWYFILILTAACSVIKERDRSGRVMFFLFLLHRASLVFDIDIPATAKNMKQRLLVTAPGKLKSLL